MTCTATCNESFTLNLIEVNFWQKFYVSDIYDEYLHMLVVVDSSFVGISRWGQGIIVTKIDVLGPIKRDICLYDVQYRSAIPHVSPSNGMEWNGITSGEGHPIYYASILHTQDFLIASLVPTAI